MPRFNFQYIPFLIPNTSLTSSRGNKKDNLHSSVGVHHISTDGIRQYVSKGGAFL